MNKHASTASSRDQISTISVGLAAGFVLTVAGAWWWRATVFQTRPVEVKTESWEHVKDAYPMTEEFSEPPKLSPEIVEAVIHSNPFSSQRRLLPLSTDEAGKENPGEASAPAKPRFVYKGRINLGKTQRAIVENTTTHKTHFLEVGQEVAGFKVLDITENRVVLSDPQTNEEVVVSLTSAAVPGSPSGTTRSGSTPSALPERSGVIGSSAQVGLPSAPGQAQKGAAQAGQSKSP